MLDNIRLFEITKKGVLNTSKPHPYLLRQPSLSLRNDIHSVYPMFSHFILWLSFNTYVTNFCISSQIYDGPTINALEQPAWVLFGNERDRDDFLKWLDKFQSWFVDVDCHDAVFPPLPSTGTHKLTMVSATKTEFHYEEWSWIAQNCVSPVYYSRHSSEMFSFTDEAEALMFKMRQQ